MKFTDRPPIPASTNYLYLNSYFDKLKTVTKNLLLKSIFGRLSSESSNGPEKWTVDGEKLDGFFWML